MKLRVGILGLPNVGKSTLFNSLARQSIAQAANFPYCTIEPNVCQVVCPDPYLAPLSELAHSDRSVASTMEWVDVAGLAKGAHRGEGLGNQFLGTLRDCACLCHVVRAFEDTQVVHVDGRVDPLEDLESIQLELLLADLAHVERRLEKTNVDELERGVLERILNSLQAGKPARSLNLTDTEQFSIKSMGLLTLKPVIYAINVDEADFLLDRDEAQNRASQLLNKFDPDNASWCTLVSAQVESVLAQQSLQEQLQYLSSMGLEVHDTNFDHLFSFHALPDLARRRLGYFTVYTGPGVPPERSRTTRAHLIATEKSLTANDLAGRIHGDIQKGFLRAETIDAPNLLAFPNWIAAKEAGQVRSEGREYALQSQDVILIKWKG